MLVRLQVGVVRIWWRCRTEEIVIVWTDGKERAKLLETNISNAIRLLTVNGSDNYS